MNYDKTLRILDPFNGWGDHSDFFKLQNGIDMKNKFSIGSDDTGLCNRLFHWEVFYDLYINSKEYNLNLAVQDHIWPELELLHLPNTAKVSYKMHNSDWYGHIRHADMYFKTIFDVETNSVRLAKKMTQDRIISMYRHQNFDFIKTDHWYSDYGYITLEKIYQSIGQDGFDKTLHNRPLSQIRILDEKINSKIKLASCTKIGIHIRRGNGVNITEDDIKTLPLEMQDDYRKYKEDTFTMVDEAYGFKPDSLYFNFIDSILEINPQQEFYISHDLPDRFLNHYYERYGNLISTKKDDRDYYINYYSSKLKNLNNLISYANVVDNIVDLFSLANCGYLVKSNVSSWSGFAEIYKKKQSDDIITITEKLENNKKDFVSEVLSFKENIDFL